MIRLYNSDNITILKTMLTDSIDAIVTDPPYGFKFMGKHWDYDVPSVELWGECLRVLKPGGHLLSFAGTRTQHRMAVRIEDAGLEIRDMIAWVYGSGFPKSHNLKGEWEGWGTALKPALEPITIARKPFTGTVAGNMSMYGCGAINIDKCRIETHDKISYGSANIGTENGIYGKCTTGIKSTQNEHGRWPANIIHDGSNEVTSVFPHTKSGSSKSSYIQKESTNRSMSGKNYERQMQDRQGDEGSASRFFYCAKASKSDRNEGCESLYEKQYSYDGRTKSIENAYQRNNSTASNNHPTVKPTSLMRYLCKLITPMGGGATRSIHGERQHWQSSCDRRVQFYRNRKRSRIHADCKSPNRICKPT